MDVASAPNMPAMAVCPAREGQLHAYWPLVADRLARLTVGEDTTFSVTAPGAISAQLVHNFSNSWETTAAKSKGRDKFRLSLSPRHPGRFDACVAATFADATVWDPAGPTAVVADPSWMHDLRMYTFIPTAAGFIPEWTAALSTIAELGFNAVHLLPLPRMGASLSPYAAVSLFAIDERYADPESPLTIDEQFDQFVETARKLGLRLCFDLVFNHIGIDSEVRADAPGWIVADTGEADGFKRAGWWCGPTWMKWEDLLLLNYDHWHPPTRTLLWQHMTEYALHWCAFAARTGGLIRLDNLHSTHPGFLTAVLAEMRHRFPDLAILGELFDTPETIHRMVREHGLNLLLATPWEHHFTPDLRRYIGELHHQAPEILHFIPVASHDSGSPAAMFGNPMATIPRYAIAAFFGTGATGSVYGLEYGIATGVPFIGFSRHAAPANAPDFRKVIRLLNSLHHEHPGLRSSGNTTFIDYDHDAILAALRDCDNELLLVAVNMDLGRMQWLPSELIPRGMWRDLVTNRIETVGVNPIPIEAAGFRILSRSIQ